MPQRHTRVYLFGHFGSGNIGNDSSLEAALHNIRKYQPHAEIICICNGPQVIAERLGITTWPINAEHSNEYVGSRIRRIIQRVVAEFNFWFKTPAQFKAGDRFVIVGTGAVDDMAVRRPWNAPYELYKWCKVAKLGGAQVVFLSVGVGPIMNRVSRFLMLKALRMADYRSYREPGAVEYLQSVGFDTIGDPVYPDLVFSLPQEYLNPVSTGVPQQKTVGLGVINYYGWKHDSDTGEPVYQEYLSKLKRLVLWLLERGYSIRLIFGDFIDQRPVHELAEYVKHTLGPDQAEHLEVEEIQTVSDLFQQIAQTDIVVASRFHNVLCALMLERPVISLGYHRKNVDLMKDMGLEAYCQHIEDFTFEKLVEQFNAFTTNPTQALNEVHQQMEHYRKLLDQQYQKIFLPASL